MARPVVTEVTALLASSPEDVWPLVTDTDRMNRLAGAGPLTFRAIEDGTGTSARFVVETVTGGFKMSYEELPFEWVYGKAFSVFRKMRSGPLASYLFALKLDGGEAGTRVTVRIELEPRAAILRPLASLRARGIARRFVDLAQQIDAHVRDNAPSPFNEPRSPSNVERIQRGIERLRAENVDPKAIERVAELLREGPDVDLIRMRPLELAESWTLTDDEVLRAFLHGVPAGLVELRWALVCPSCRTASEEITELSSMPDIGHCQMCDVNFSLDLDRAVEATFVPHPSVREVSRQMFCIGGPSRTPHVLVQANFAPGEEKTLEVPDTPGRYRLFLRGGSSASIEVKADAAAEAHVTLNDTGAVPGDLTVRPGAKLLVKSALTEPRHVKIERLGYASRAATAHLVSTFSEFRRFFSGDLLKRGTPLKVAHVALLFTDLTGSTALYAKAGDAAAFRLVDDHFDVLRAAIEGERGTIVKTMGDAVMAAFSDSKACLRASLACLAQFEAFRASHKYGGETGLKLGMFAGACYVVTANGALDYFGQTANVASRLQHLAESGELIVEDGLIDLGDLAGANASEAFEVRVKGVDYPIRVRRVKLAGAISQPTSTLLVSEAQSPRT